VISPGPTTWMWSRSNYLDVAPGPSIRATTSKYLDTSLVLARLYKPVFLSLSSRHLKTAGGLRDLVGVVFFLSSKARATARAKPNG
jgi:hypothetical protein